MTRKIESVVEGEEGGDGEEEGEDFEGCGEGEKEGVGARDADRGEG